MKRSIKHALVGVLLAGTALAAVPVVAQQMNGQPPMQAQKQDGTGPMGQGPMAGGMGAGPMGGQGMMGQMGGADLDDGPMGMMFDRFDADGDGTVTKEEIAAKRTADAVALDANGDGKLSAEELVAADMRRVQLRVEERVKARIAAQDADGDGMLSAAELAMPEMPMMMFERLDANGDGALGKDELAAAKARMQGGMMGRGERGGHGHEGKHMGGHMGGGRHGGQQDGMIGQRWMMNPQGN